MQQLNESVNNCSEPFRLQKAYELASKTIYKTKHRTLPNTDTLDTNNASQTILQRAAMGGKLMTQIIDSKISGDIQ